MKWGDDWLAGKDGPPVILSHKTCGRVLRPQAICSACKREVSAEDVQIDLGSINSPEGGCSVSQMIEKVDADKEDVTAELKRLSDAGYLREEQGVWKFIADE